MVKPQQQEATVITIFGATGDLSRNKIIPSLYKLYERHELPHSFYVIGMSHRDYSDEDFRSFLEREVFSKKKADQATLESFLQHMLFVGGDFEDPEAYSRVGQRIETIEGEVGTCPNKLFYLSVAPLYYKSILKLLAQSHIADACGTEEWARVLIEKPFGQDMESAKELDVLLSELFEERQIFRIDHYLAKESVQNILTFRFANTIFEPVWNKDHIKSVTIKMLERGGAEGRGHFYDSIGALRDVGQNHILQMLALVAMEGCEEVTADTIRTCRAEAMEDIEPIKDMAKQVFRGQYIGYRDVEGVDNESTTETYFDITAYVDNKRWKGVPFRLLAGKGMKEDDVEITVTFKNDRRLSFVPEEYEDQGENVLTFQVRPDESITLTLWVGLPGVEERVSRKIFSFKYADLPDHEKIHTGAYEKVLYSCIAGDLTVFPSTDEVMAQWKFITPIIEKFDTIPLQEYEEGEKYILGEL